MIIRKNILKSLNKHTVLVQIPSCVMCCISEKGHFTRQMEQVRLECTALQFLKQLNVLNKGRLLLSTSSERVNYSCSTYGCSAKLS